MKSVFKNWQLISFLLMRFVVAPFLLWWLDERTLSLEMHFAFYSFFSFFLWIGFIALYVYLQYLFRGYYVYDERCEFIVYKDRKHGCLDFQLRFRYKDDKIDGVNIYVPAGNKWEETVPDWAKEHRKVIVQRLKKHYSDRGKTEFIEYE
jgi:hypothetical protein